MDSWKKYNQRPAEKIRDMNLALQYLLPKAAILEKMGQSSSANSIFSSIANSPHAKTYWIMFHQEWNYDMIRGMAYLSVLDYSKAVEYLEKAPYANNYASQLKVIAHYENHKRSPTKQIEGVFSGIFEEPESSGGCGEGTVLIDGVCQLASTPKAKSSFMSIDPIYLIIGAVAIGGAIAVIIAVTKRGSKTPKPAKQELDEYEEEYLTKQKPAKQKPVEKKKTSAFCENCGKSLKPTAKFCGGCGTARS